MFIYCEVELDIPAHNTKLIFRRGGKDGPVMGTAESCPQKPHQTDIHLVSPKIVIPFKHSHSRFEQNGKRYCWNHRQILTELIEDGNAEPRFTVSGRFLQLDIIVMTVMLMQIRKEQMLGPVCQCPTVTDRNCSTSSIKGIGYTQMKWAPSP
jgi:hypothetical protein